MPARWLVLIRDVALLLAEFGNTHADLLDGMDDDQTLLRYFSINGKLIIESRRRTGPYVWFWLRVRGHEYTCFLMQFNIRVG